MKGRTNKELDELIRRWIASPSYADYPLGEESRAALDELVARVESAYRAYAKCQLRFEEVKDERDRLADLVRRFRQWDDLPARADGPYWIAEADRALASMEGETSDRRRRKRTPGRG